MTEHTCFSTGSAAGLSQGYQGRQWLLLEQKPTKPVKMPGNVTIITLARGFGDTFALNLANRFSFSLVVPLQLHPPIRDGLHTTNAR